MFDFSSIKKMVQGADARLQSLRSELEALKRQREAILAAPAAKSDVKALLTEYVNGANRSYVTALRSSLNHLVRSPVTMGNHALAHRSVSLFGAVQPFGESSTSKDLDQVLCGLFDEHVGTKLLQLVDAMEWPTEGLPIADRGAAVQRLDERISKLMREESDLLSAAQAAGITLD